MNKLLRALQTKVQTVYYTGQTNNVVVFMGKLLIYFFRFEKNMHGMCALPGKEVNQ